MKYLVWIITIFLNVTGHHFLPKEAQRSRASLNNYTGYEISAEESHNESVSIINQFVELKKKVQMQQQGTLDEYEITLEKLRLLLAKKDDEIKSLKRSQDACSTIPDMKYAILTGYPRNDETAQMEVIDESGLTKICNSKSKYPLKVAEATGVFTNNYIIVCGGAYPETPACYTYADDQQGWTKLADMDTPRFGSASVSIDDGILVTGGLDDGINTLKTSEIVFLNGTVKQGKPLPEPRYEHCLVEYQGQIISTGGYDENGDSTSTVWSFNNHEEFTMTNKPSMIYKRAWHACGIVHSSLHDGRPLLVVAGAFIGDGMDKSEFWDFTIPGSQWQSCSEDLPVEMYGPRMTHTADKKNLLMTYEKGIYSFNCRSSNDCHWTKESYELEISRRYHILMTVPSSLVENC